MVKLASNPRANWIKRQVIASLHIEASVFDSVFGQHLINSETYENAEELILQFLDNEEKGTTLFFTSMEYKVETEGIFKHSLNCC